MRLDTLTKLNVYLDSVTTALHAFHRLEQWVTGDAPRVMTEPEVRCCFPVSLAMVRKHRELSSPFDVLAVWELAQWCRERDVARMAGINYDKFGEHMKWGTLTRVHVPWLAVLRSGGNAVSLVDAFRFLKMQKVRPFLWHYLGAVNRLDTESIAELPLDNILGIITSREQVQSLCTLSGPRK